MARLFAAAVVIFAFLPALASEPGQPLDCSDWVFLQSGYTCHMILGSGSPPIEMPRGAGSQFDNQGRLFRVTVRPVGDCGTASEGQFRTQLEWLNGGTWSVLAYVQDRCAQGHRGDDLKPLNVIGGVGDLAFDSQNGRMVVPLVDSCVYEPCDACPPGTGLYWLAAFDGFATLFDILQTFTPCASSLSFRIPYMPDGLAAADHFDTYWGDLANPIDFSQAHPLQCNYPGSPPHVGDYLTVIDPLPNPSAGHGYYYVTAATYQGQTRYGRKASGGRLSGRDPAALRACVQPKTNR